MFKNILSVLISVFMIQANAGVGDLVVGFKELAAILKNDTVIGNTFSPILRIDNNTIGLRGSYMANTKGIFYIGLQGSTTRGSFNNASLLAGISGSKNIKLEESVGELINLSTKKLFEELKLKYYSNKFVSPVTGETTNVVSISLADINAEQAETIMKSLSNLKSRIDNEGVEAVKASLKPKAATNADNW